MPIVDKDTSHRMRQNDEPPLKTQRSRSESIGGVTDKQSISHLLVIPRRYSTKERCDSGSKMSIKVSFFKFTSSMGFRARLSFVAYIDGVPFIQINGLTVVIVVAINLCPRATRISGSPLCAQHNAHAACRYALEDLKMFCEIERASPAAPARQNSALICKRRAETVTVQTTWCRFRRAPP